MKAFFVGTIVSLMSFSATADYSFEDMKKMYDPEMSLQTIKDLHHSEQDEFLTVQRINHYFNQYPCE